jgi:cellulose synthase/poly-beta-1,6-N-acetylglucosamine synthase-like glycosyltransferase
MSDSLPFVSVIMPVRNEAEFIRQSLSAARAQNYPADRMEILVVDGQSSDQTADLVQVIAAEDTRVRLLDNPGQTAARGLNVGLRAARGDVIVRVDGHAVIAPDYVRQCVRYLQETGAECVGGPLRFVGLTPMGQAIGSAHRSPFCVPTRYRVSRRAEYADTVYLGAWPRRVFDRVGFFNEALVVNQDYEFSYRIRRAGGRIYLTPDIQSAYYGRQTLRALWQQFFRYGRWKLRMLADHPASVRPRQVMAPLLVAALIGGALLSPITPWIAWLWALTIISYSAANLAASVRQASRDNWRLLLRLPIVFACVHLSWGSGFLIEAALLVYKKLRRKRTEPG